MANVVIVDENNKIVGADERKVITQKRLIRRIARVLLLNDKNEIFLQMRSSSKGIWPNTWDQSAAGHVEPNETDEEAAIRGLNEELGIKRGTLTHLFDFYCEENYGKIHIKEWNAVFKTKYKGEKFTFDKNEVNDGKWFKVEDLNKLIKRTPLKFSQGFIYTWKRFIEQPSSPLINT